MVFDFVANCIGALSYRMEPMLMVGMHKLDCRSDVDPVGMADRQCIVRERFRFLNCAHCVDNRVK